MKLQTLLLPTGEFVLVISEAPTPLTTGLDDLRERTGAAYVLATDQAVEVDNALVDEKARRAEPSFIRATGGELVWRDPALPTEKESQRALVGAIDRNIFQQIEAGTEFSPAGLVVNNDRSIGRAAEPQEKPLPHPDTYWLGSHDVVVGTGGPVDKPPVAERLTGGWDH